MADLPTPIRDSEFTWHATAATLLGPAGGDLAAAHALAVGQGFVLTPRDACASGVSPARVRSLTRRGVWSAPRRGVLAVLAPADRGGQAALAASAACLTRPGTTIAFASAAAVLGVPLLRRPHRPVLTAPPGSQCNSRDDVDVHAAALAPDDVCRWFGLPVTGYARTCVDVARSHGVAAGVVAMDAALHERVTDLDSLLRALAAQRGWPYVRRAREAYDLADGDSESVLESLLRVHLVTHGLPMPALQRRIHTELGWFRVDLLYPVQRVIVEADGLEKYRAGWDTLVEERRRQEALERAGFRVVRVTWRELRSEPDDVLRRVGNALAEHR